MINAQVRKILDVKIKDYFLYDKSDTNLSYIEGNMIKSINSSNIVIPIIAFIGMTIAIISLFVELEQNALDLITIITIAIYIMLAICVPIHFYNSGVLYERRYMFYLMKKEKNNKK